MYLNTRQRAMIQAIYDADQALEQHYRGLGSQDAICPKAVWRWMSYYTIDAVDSTLKTMLRNVKLIDEGTIPTWKSLQARGLIELCYQQGELGESIPFIKITFAGRRLVRRWIGEAAQVAQNEGILSEAQWYAMVRLWHAGQDGETHATLLYGPAALTWPLTLLRLQHYRPQPLIETFSIAKQVRSAGDNVGEEAAILDYRIRLTHDGRALYQECWQEYEERYPSVDTSMGS